MGPDEHLFELDLTLDELHRRELVLRAIGPGWDPIAVLRGEEAAATLLYSGLDERQRAIYADLVRAGVLTPRGAGRDAA